MKTILKTFVLLVVMSLTVACSSDDDSGPTTPTFNEENFMSGYLVASGFDEETDPFIDSGSYEFGLEFSPTVTGKITALTVALPGANPSLRVTLWNKETISIIKTEIVNVETADVFYTFDIVDIILEKDKEYAITMNSNHWYDREKTDGTATTYPISVGNIQINAYKWIGGDTQTYPTILSTTYYAGDLSFIFQQTE